MATQGKGLLAVWTDVEPAAEADFNEWYNREHLAERAAVRGFLNARRYAAVQGSPRYFAAYDTERLAVLGAPEYVRVLGNQSAWSRRILPRFRNNTRMIAALAADQGAALGGAVLTVRLAPGPGGAAALAGALGRLAEPVRALPGIVRVSVALGVVAGLDAEPAQPARWAAERPDALALLVEGVDVPALQGAAAGALAESALLGAGAASVLQHGYYRLLCAVLA
jgi:hypothetical protein